MTAVTKSADPRYRGVAVQAETSRLACSSHAGPAASCGAARWHHGSRCAGARARNAALALEAQQQARDDFAHRTQFIGQLLVRLGQGGAMPEQRRGSFQGLTAEYLCIKLGAAFIVRGLRNSTDHGQERSIALMNHALRGVETVFLLRCRNMRTSAAPLFGS